MEIRLGSVFLTAALLTGCSWFHRAPQPAAEIVPEAPEADPSIIDPQVQRRVVKTPKIKAKNFELGASSARSAFRTSVRILCTAYAWRIT